jgi:hypothetical protein
MNAVLALNSGKNERGMPNRETVDRTNAAMLFAADIGASLIVMVGGDATCMSDYAARRFPRAPKAVTENDSMDTIEGAHRVKIDILKPLGVAVVDIFTSDFHVPRTELDYLCVLGSSYQVNVHGVYSGLKPETLSKVMRRERVQMAYSQLKLIGIGPKDDSLREQRLSHFRYRNSRNIVARAFGLGDRMTQVKRPQSSIL